MKVEQYMIDNAIAWNRKKMKDPSCDERDRSRYTENISQLEKIRD